MCPMWQNLTKESKTEYQRMILGFASLTEMFAQKAENESEDVALSPIINSKYQETVFQKVFNASAEDIGNTAYDAALCLEQDDKELKFLVGIKTFGISSGAQKIAQFKANHDDWAEIINMIKSNAYNEDGTVKTKAEIDSINHDLYLSLAGEIAYLRNVRIDSAESNIQGFEVAVGEDNVQAVYHVLMPSKKGDKPCIYVGETSYDKIDVDNIRILGCTTANNPTNFEFSDGNHKYKFTSADSQLLMHFNNTKIVEEKWPVVYAKDAYAIFSEIADRIAEEQKGPAYESYSWKITNKDGEVEQFSGFNSFYGLGSKLGQNEREARVERLHAKYAEIISAKTLEIAIDYLHKYLTDGASKAADKKAKVTFRKTIINYLDFIGNKEFKADAMKLLFRPQDEMYIPLPSSVKFHQTHPDFFGPGIGELVKESGKYKLSKPKEERKFNLIFDPSGDVLPAFISQDGGKAIESYEKQSYLGEWILRKVFQLDEYEPLTSKRLKEIGINGIRLVKYAGSTDIHLQFVWIDDKDIPGDYIK